MADRDPAHEARALMRASPAATLATLLADGSHRGGAWPFASLVLTACAHDGAPLLLLSQLAEHTRNLEADSRVSLLFDGTAESARRLAGARVTVLGRAAPSASSEELDRFIARHPEAREYAAFSDFGLLRVEVERAHLVAGFGRIRWVEGEALRFDVAAAGTLGTAEGALLAKWNDQDGVAPGLATGLLGLDAGPWRLTGCDPEGCDMRAEGRTARIPFATPVVTPEDASAALASLAKAAIGR